MKKQHSTRFDLSEWVIHFVHDRKVGDEAYHIAVNDPSSLASSYVNADYFEDDTPKNIKPNITSMTLADDAKAFDVLKSILHDGYIHSGWSFRSKNPNVIGPYSAVCFTEMPLYALEAYAQYRKDRGQYATFCGIAFKREELFELGARQVIYGTSGQATYESIDADKDRHLYRSLDEEKTGITLKEQYRYVSTRLYNKMHRDRGYTEIDWTFEREWRWPLTDDRLKVPGFPFLYSVNPDYLSEILIIVETNEQLVAIQDYCRALNDAKEADESLPYDLAMFQKLRFTSKEVIACHSDFKTSLMPVEDKEYPAVLLMPNYPPDADYDKAKVAFEEAKRHYCEVLDRYSKMFPSNSMEFHHAYIGTDKYTGYTKNLFETCGFIPQADGFYTCDISTFHGTKHKHMIEVAAGVAAKYLSEALGQPFVTKIV